MSVYFFDLALLEKIKGVFPNSVLGTFDSYFEEKGTEQAGVIQFPMIGLNRVNWSISKEERNWPMMRNARYRGMSIDDEGTAHYHKFPALPLEIHYQIDIISDKRKDADGLATEIAWFLTLNPKLAFKMAKPYEWFANDASILIDDIVDNSDVTSFTARGRLYRTTFDITLVDAVSYHVADYLRVESIPVSMDLVVEIPIDVVVDPDSLPEDGFTVPWTPPGD